MRRANISQIRVRTDAFIAAFIIWAILGVANSAIGDQLISIQFERKLKSASTYDDLFNAIAFAKRSASVEDARQIADRLISSIPSTEVMFFNVFEASDRAFEFASTVLLVPQPNRLWNTYTYSVQDVAIWGGRCAWTAEQLFGVCLPPVQRNYSLTS